MLYRLSVEQGSYKLAQLVEDGFSVYRSMDGFYYLECSLKEAEELGILMQIESSDVDVSKLFKIAKPRSRTGLWAYYLLLRSKGQK